MDACLPVRAPGRPGELVRLRRAAYDLAFRERSVLDAALDAGYESPEALARIFKKRFGLTPSDWRALPDWMAGHAALAPLHELRRDIVNNAGNLPEIRIVDFPETRIAVLEHRGDPRRLNDTVRHFIAWRRENRLPPQVSATFNILHNDPTNTPPDDYRLDFCAAVTTSVAPNDHGVVGRAIPAGRCATFRVKGPDEVVGPLLIRLYREWLPGSGEEPRDFPPFLQRVTLVPQVPEHEAIVDVFVPLK